MSLINYPQIELDSSSAPYASLLLHSTGSWHSIPFPDQAPLHRSNKTPASNSYKNTFKI